MIRHVNKCEATIFYRCRVNQIDDELNGTSSPSFNMSLLSNFIPLTSKGEIDQCRRFVSVTDHNMTNDCDGSYVYDDKYYKSSRVIDVSHIDIYVMVTYSTIVTGGNE